MAVRLSRQPTKITFFDLPTQVGIPTSPNTWKLRFALNFKRLTYTTHWTPTSLATEICQAHGIPPSGTHADGSPHYTVPALVDFTPQRDDPRVAPVCLSDSTRIIEYLERTYPDPTASDSPSKASNEDEDDYPHPRVLFPAHSRALHAFVEHHVQNVLKPPLYNLFTLSLYATKLPRDQVDYAARRTRAKGVGSVEELQVSGAAAREAEWAKLRDAFKVLADAQCEAERYYSQAEGAAAWKTSAGIPVFQPPGVTYADLAVCAVLMMLRNISPGEAWPVVREWDDGRWARLLGEVERRWGRVEGEMKTDW
ncbi:hypothetical protein DENSPDRAFT_838977 [Dentipellis sp. KUC8613]|nr:hypothetical protein DENSPDRAFT_838977 [Dentipellis sp. KUC8613]